MSTQNTPLTFEERKTRYFDLFNGHVGYISENFTSVTHSFFGFPLRLEPGVYMAHPGFSASSSIAMDLMGPDLSGKDVLDVGCGSGVIALRAAFNNANTVVACDISPQAVELTGFNAQINDLSDKIEVLQSDVLGSVLTEMPDRKFDLIIANLWFPPTDPESQGTRLMALDAYDRFFTDVGKVLKNDGVAYLTSGEFADVAGTLELMEKHGMNPLITRGNFALFGGAVDIEMHLYSFGKDGQAKPPLFIPGAPS